MDSNINKWSSVVQRILRTYGERSETTRSKSPSYELIFKWPNVDFQTFQINEYIRFCWSVPCISDSEDILVWVCSPHFVWSIFCLNLKISANTKPNKRQMCEVRNSLNMNLYKQFDTVHLVTFEYTVLNIHFYN